MFDQVKIYLNAGLNVLVEGPVGCGKTARVKQLAEELDRDLITIILSILDPVDIKGIPCIIDEQTVWMTPDMWPKETDKPVLINFDEIDRAGTAQVNAILTLLYGGNLGEYQLPKSALIIACCNGISDSGTKALSKAANNRFAHVTVTPDNTEVANYLSAKNADPRLVAYISRSHELFTQEIQRGQRAFPTPRTIDMVNDILPLVTSDNMTEIVAGLIGMGAAVELAAFFDLANMIPDIASILDHPDAAILPSSLDAEYFVTGVLSNAVKADVTAFRAVSTYSERLSRECHIVTMERCVSDNAMLKETDTYTKYALANKDIFT